MTDKITLSTVGSLIDTTTAGNTINNNFSTVQTAFDNTLSRDGTSPNQMENNFDMNNFQIINLPNPVTANSPVRLQDLETFSGGGTIAALPAGGNTGDALVKNSNTNFDVKWSADSTEVAAGTNIVVTGTSPATVATTANPTFATSVTTPQLKNSTGTVSIPASGAITIPAVTDTLTGKATTDTLTNKTITSAANTITLGSNIVSASSGSGNLVYATSPTLVTPTLGAATATTVNGNTLTTGTGTLTLGANTLTVNGGTTLTPASNAIAQWSSGTLSSTTAIPVGFLNNGTSATSSTFWRGDGTWSAPPTGSIIFLETLPTSGAPISTTVSWSGFSAIEINFMNVVPVTTSTTFLMQISTSGGLQTTSYATEILIASATTPGATTGITTGYQLSNTNSVSNTANQGISGTLRLYNVASTTANKHCVSSFIGPASQTGITSGIYTGSALALTGCTLAFSSGNVSSCLIKVYGIV